MVVTPLVTIKIEPKEVPLIGGLFSPVISLSILYIPSFVILSKFRLLAIF